MKNVLAEWSQGGGGPGRYCPGTPSDHPHSQRPDTYVVCGCCGASTTARAIALTQIVPISSSLYTLFYSVIYNSVTLFCVQLGSHNKYIKSGGEKEKSEMVRRSSLCGQLLSRCETATYRPGNYQDIKGYCAHHTRISTNYSYNQRRQQPLQYSTQPP